MKNITFLTFCLLALPLILLAPSAEAQWEEVINFDSVTDLIDNDRCIHRIKFIDLHNDIHRDYYFSVDRIRQFRDDDGNPTSISLRANVYRGVLGPLYFGGAFYGNAYQNITALYTPQSQPFDLGLNVLLNPAGSMPNHQVSLSYYYWHENGQLYTSTQLLKKDKFTVEALCPSPQGNKVLNQDDTGHRNH